MTNFQLLDKSKHRELRVDLKYLPEFGHSLSTVMLVNSELLSAQREYPILFRKHKETGRLYPTALLGFHENENLFLDGTGGWNARHIPLAVARGPFQVGFVEGTENQLVAVDLDDSRVSDYGDGEKLFSEDGENSRYLEYVSKALFLLHDAQKGVFEMTKLFLDLNLIEPLTLDIEFKNGDKLCLQGSYTIPEEKMYALPSADLKTLNELGFLSAAYQVMFSLGNVEHLVEMRNAKTVI